VLIAVWRLSPQTSERVDARSLRSLVRLAAAVIVLFALCLSATPKRLDHLAPHLPGLANAAGAIDAICEYGHRHSLEPKTVFRSRLPLANIQHEDSTRADEVAALLDQSRRAYEQFLRETSPVADPFAYEARVRLFARDRNLWRARKAMPGSVEQREHMTVAYRENLILEEVFGETLRQSSFRWRRPLRQKVASAQDPDAHFVSDVARHLITVISEGGLRSLLLAALAVLLACDLTLSRAVTRPQRGPRPG
jgi:hypothetical protein